MATLPDFIRRHKDLILDHWLAEVRRLSSAQNQPAEIIRDHIPEFLDRLADALDRNGAGAASLRGLPNLHGALRVREGYDLRQVVAEYRVIRAVILGLYSKRGDISEESRPKLQPIATMNAVLDVAIADAVDQYSIDEGRAREMFIGMLGHDLRDPLNTIAFNAHVLRERGAGLDPQTLKIAARIGSSAKRMDAMIRDLLDFARGRLGGAFPVVPTAVDVRTLIADTVSEINEASLERSVTCLTGPTDGNFDAEWDPDRIAQALTNLLSNAVAHGNDPIVVELRDEDDSIAIEVRNAGEIPSAALPTMFAPFSPPSTDRRRGGALLGAERRRGHLGLGLYIVREIAVAHGGHVSAESRDGETIFRLTLPRIVPKLPASES